MPRCRSSSHHSGPWRAAHWLDLVVVCTSIRSLLVDARSGTHVHVGEGGYWQCLNGQAGDEPRARLKE